MQKMKQCRTNFCKHFTPRYLRDHSVQWGYNPLATVPKERKTAIKSPE